MAANQILKQMTAFMNFTNEGFKYNLQVFPDTLTGAVFLFAILFQSPPFAALFGSILILNVINPSLARVLGDVMGNTGQAKSDGSRCSGHFPGVSFERLISAAEDGKFGELENGVPSYYASFLGFLGAYVGMLPVIYWKEISYSPVRKASTTVGLVVLGLVLLLGVLHRVFNCESLVSVLIGMLGGGVVGVALVAFFALLSDRRLTNILSFPLIRDKTTDGKPIYVCERPGV
jgi:hypothetical protein